MADATGKERSGALLFASDALEQNREVCAVPGSVLSVTSEGTNQLLKEGARPITCGWDVLEEYQPLFPDTLKQKKPGAELVEKKLADPPRETGEGFYKLREPIRQKEIDKEKTAAYIDLQQQLEGLSEHQLKIIAAMNEPHRHIDDIIRDCGLPAPTVLSELTMMQIQGFVKQEPGKRFSLNVQRK